MNKLDSTEHSVSSLEIHALDKQNLFLYKTYAWMFAGLLITAATAYLLNLTGLVVFILQVPFSILILIILQISIVIGLSHYVNRVNSTVAGLLFLFYSVITAITLAPIILIYTNTSLVLTFTASSLMFAIMAAYGYFTKQDLTTFGNIAIMGLIGIILGAVLNMFFNNSIVEWIITYAGIAVFLILTAYDMQKLKDISFVGGLTKKHENNIAIVGALSLYLDFINLFLYVLRIFGNRK